MNFRLFDILASIKINKPNGKDDSLKGLGSNVHVAVGFSRDNDLGGPGIGDDTVLFESFAKKCLDKGTFHQDMRNPFGYRFKLLRMGAFLTVASGDRMYGDGDMDEEFSSDNEEDMDEEFSNDDEMLEEL